MYVLLEYFCVYVCVYAYKCAHMQHTHTPCMHICTYFIFIIWIYVVEKIPEIYEAAVKKKPKNDELLSHLFMAYVRTEDYKKQQQTALALHKVIPSNPYYSWAVMSIVM